MAKTSTVVKPPRRVPIQDHVRYVCVKHGWVTDALPGCTVWCSCGKKAKVAA